VGDVIWVAGKGLCILDIWFLWKDDWDVRW
jgi:hypothetical protein